MYEHNNTIAGRSIDISPPDDKKREKELVYRGKIVRSHKEEVGIRAYITSD